jgi:hypothetical protein
VDDGTLRRAGYRVSLGDIPPCLQIRPVTTVARFLEVPPPRPGAGRMANYVVSTGRRIEPT